VFREAVRRKMTAEELVTSLRSAGASLFASPTIKAVKAIWSERASELIANPALAQTLTIGQV
jgi:hypothetical protein